MAGKTYSNFSCQNSNNLWHDAQIKQWFAHPWTHWEKLNFNQSFVSKHQFFLFENCCLDNKKEDQGSWGQHLKKFWSGEQKRNLQGPKSKTQTTCNMAVIEKAWLFNVPLLFNVAPLDNSLLWILWFSSILLFRLIKKKSWKPLIFIYHLATGNL